MFHYRDNLFFGRRADGSVRILKFPNAPADFPKADADYWSFDPQPLFDVTVDADGWSSAVASVSAGGEESGRFFEARKFHG